LRHWGRLGEACRFDQDRIEPAFALHQAFNDADEVAAHSAANAAIIHFEDFFIGVDNQVIVDADFAELVDYDGEFLAMLIGQDAVQEGGFASAEEAGQHGYRDGLGHGRLDSYSGRPRQRLV
jgi:hypothetical protein